MEKFVKNQRSMGVCRGFNNRGDTLSPPGTTCPPGFLTLAACLHSMTTLLEHSFAQTTEYRFKSVGVRVLINLEFAFV